MKPTAGIDNGRAFDWSRASQDYARYRDIYPEVFYQKIIEEGFCIERQRVLDIGTGTGVLPRNLYRYGADFVGTDISDGQIEQAKQLAAKEQMNISFFCMPAEDMAFPDHSFDSITACQCFFYFNHEILVPKLFEFLKPGGRILLMYMAWLPYEDEIAGKSEAMVLKFNPEWSGCGETRHPIEIPQIYDEYFQIEKNEVFDLQVPFTKESWNGRMRSCRGIGASLPQESIEKFNQEHLLMLDQTVPQEFEILHYAAFAVLKANK